MSALSHSAETSCAECIPDVLSSEGLLVAVRVYVVVAFCQSILVPPAEVVGSAFARYCSLLDIALCSGEFFSSLLSLTAIAVPLHGALSTV